MPDNLLPPNATEYERNLEASAARIGDVQAGLIRMLWNPDTCPAALLPYLAWALSVDVWDSSWTEAAKRQAVRDAYFVHAHKGTPGSIKRAIKNAGYGDVTIVEGINADRYDGSILHDGTKIHGSFEDWAVYRIYLTQPVTAAQAQEIIDLLDNTAPARSSLAGLLYTAALYTYNAAIDHDGAHTYGLS